MKNFLNSIAKGSGIDEPENLKKAFKKNFGKAVNVEWSRKKDCYEALFYIDTIEYIAIFNEKGKLSEYKMFLPVNYLPATIRAKIEEKGEIMNVVLINKGNKILYEAIIRVESKIRKLIVISNLGKMIEEKGL